MPNAPEIFQEETDATDPTYQTVIDAITARYGANLARYLTKGDIPVTRFHLEGSWLTDAFVFGLSNAELELDQQYATYTWVINPISPLVEPPGHYNFSFINVPPRGEFLNGNASHTLGEVSWSFVSSDNGPILGGFIAGFTSVPDLGQNDHIVKATQAVLIAASEGLQGKIELTEGFQNARFLPFVCVTAVEK